MASIKEMHYFTHKIAQQNYQNNQNTSVLFD